MSLNNDLKERMAKHSYSQLVNIIESKSDYTEEAYIAATDELNRRKVKIRKYEEASNDELMRILLNKESYDSFEVDLVHQVVKMRGLETKISENKLEQNYNNEVQYLRSIIKENRYPVLKRISLIYFILAWISILVAVIFSLINLGDNLGLSVSIIIGGSIVSTTLFLISEVIKLFLDIEKNTRVSASKYS